MNGLALFTLVLSAVQSPASAATCDGTWKMVAAPVVGSSTYLAAVDASSSSNVWAVGDFFDGTNFKTLAMRLTRTGWAVVPTPNPGPGNHALYDVVVFGPNDVWALGGESTTRQASYFSLHWNGSSWSAAYIPVPGPASVEALDGVASDTLFVAGSFWRHRHDHTLIERWDGTSWQIQAVPNVDTYNNRLRDVSVVSSAEAYAVGSFENGGEFQTLVEHWDGIAWTIEESQNLGVSPAFFGVGAVAGHAWAVGRTNVQPQSFNSPLIEAWDGASWQTSPTPLFNTDTWPYGVDARSSSDAWAVGVTSGLTLVLHWNGSGWTQVPSPSASGRFNELRSVRAVPRSGVVWAVGTSYLGSETKGLIEYYC